MATTPTQTTPPPQVKFPTFEWGQFLHAVGVGLHPLLQLWWLLVLVVLVQGLRLVGPVRRRLRINRAGMAELDGLDWREFEHSIAALFRQLGFAAELTSRAAGDFGADIIREGGEGRTVVQVKQRMRRNVGIDAVNQVVASRRTYEADHTMVVTNWYFTRAARKQAAHNDVELWDRDRLAAAVLQARSSVSERPDSSSPSDGVADQAHCARCGKHVTDKVKAYCQARPRQFGGLVYCYDHQQAV